MTTPMHVYSEIAQRYGAKTEEEVDRFFQIDILELPVEIQQAIFDELLDSHAVPSQSMPRPSAPFVRPQPSPPPPTRPISDDDWD